MTDLELIKTAVEAREYSYSPYSGFKVGAALLGKSGKVYLGVNVENASFGATNCAERTAVFKAVSEGHKAFTAIAIAANEDEYTDLTVAYGTWEVKKFYRHLWKENQIHFDWNVPLASMGGATGLELADSAFEIFHKTQETSGQSVLTTGLEYDNGIPSGCADAIRGLFARESVIVTKRGKNGPVDQDIIPMIFDLNISEISAQELELTARVCAQNPSLNPQQMVTAIEKELPDCKPDFSRIFRREAIAADGTIFR